MKKDRQRSGQMESEALKDREEASWTQMDIRIGAVEPACLTSNTLNFRKS